MWRLLKLGVSLTEQGYDPVSAALVDWLLEIDGLVNEAQGGSDGS